MVADRSYQPRSRTKLSQSSPGYQSSRRKSQYLHFAGTLPNLPAPCGTALKASAASRASSTQPNRARQSQLRQLRLPRPHKPPRRHRPDDHGASVRSRSCASQGAAGVSNTGDNVHSNRSRLSILLPIPYRDAIALSGVRSCGDGCHHAGRSGHCPTRVALSRSGEGARTGSSRARLTDRSDAGGTRRSHAQVQCYYRPTRRGWW